MNRIEHGNRIVLPQWMPARRAASMREAETFAGEVRVVDYEPSLKLFNDLLAEFRTAPSPFVASDLMGVAVVLGRDQEARELAEYVVAQAITGHAAQLQAHTILGHVLVTKQIDEKKSIRTTKQRVRKFPRDAFAWIDQARLYTILGQYEKAKRAVLVALHLEPADRIIVRSAIRFFAHHNDWDEALYYANRAYRANNDPFILGPLLSIGTQLEKLPIRLRPTANTALQASDAFLYSEVLAAIGTFELLNGAHQRSKKFFKRAWEDPTRAVVSQSQWVLREHLPNLAPEQRIDFSQSAEAMSWLRFAVLDFKGAVIRGHEWVLEEPYSRSAHIHTSNTATLIDDYSAAQAAAERGLRANPGDHILINNLAFAQLRSGEWPLAAMTFEPLRSSLDDPKKIAEMATFGLLRMSQGHIAEGVKCYEEAIRRANDSGDNRIALRAALNLLISSLDVSNLIDPDLLKQTASRLRDIRDPGCLGTAMSLSRRLSDVRFTDAEGLKDASKEFTSAVKEGQRKLLQTMFAESVQSATEAVPVSEVEGSVASNDESSREEVEGEVGTEAVRNER